MILEFEDMAASSGKVERHISPGEALFLWQLIQDHGSNYKVSLIDLFLILSFLEQ